jgi:hypothetical protein
MDPEQRAKAPWVPGMSIGITKVSLHLPFARRARV